MAAEGFEERRRQGETRVRERNLTEMTRTLEGPGSETRLARVRGQFAQVSAKWDRRDRRSRLWRTLRFGLAIFAIVVAFGLIWPYVAPILLQPTPIWR